MHKDTLVVNFLGSPGSGKSTLCSAVFSELKWLNINCEMALEFAKEEVLNDSTHMLKNQFYIFGNQIQRIFRLLDKVDVILTDSPLLNSVIYDTHGNEHFENLIVGEHNKLNNLNYFIRRVKPYHKTGRVQSEKESDELAFEIKDMLLYHEIKFTEIDGTKENANVIVQNILERLKK